VDPMPSGDLDPAAGRAAAGMKALQLERCLLMKPDTRNLDEQLSSLLWIHSRAYCLTRGAVQ
jgi:hypothetical protein